MQTILMFRGSFPPSLILLRLLHPSRTLPHPRRSPHTTTPTPHSIAKPTARVVKRASRVERVEDRRVARLHQTSNRTRPRAARSGHCPESQGDIRVVAPHPAGEGRCARPDMGFSPTRPSSPSAPAVEEEVHE